MTPENEQRDAGDQHPEGPTERDESSFRAVGDVPGIQRHADERQRLGQADHPEGERIARRLEYLPADHDDLRLARDRGRRIAEDEAEEVRNP